MKCASNRTPSRIVLSLSLAFMFGGCGPTLRSALSGKNTLPVSVAVLPAEYTSDIAREKVDLVRTNLIAELRNSKFIVADDKLVTATCSTPQCPERAELASKYLIDGFVSLKLASFSKNNFLAGYYNALSGEITFSNKAGAELVNVTHTESERGGVIFESGQVLQGIISQVKHSGESVYEALASKFAKRIVEELPARAETTAGTQSEGSEIALNTIDASWTSPSTYRICAKGTPSSFAFVLLGKEKTTLRETNPGEYCGAFSSLAFAAVAGPLTVELRSAFGDAVRREIPQPVNAPCSLVDRLVVTDAGTARSITVLCAAIGQDSPAGVTGCTEKLKQCSAEKLLVYRGTGIAGPFEKVSEVKSSQGSVPAPPGNFQAVAVGTNGLSSLPASLESKPQ